ncbi:MAG: hypothetical protein B6D63_00220 [Candidatus Latescibacteria bacterium 4484_7]|nr:MAG: hypothetical protein B6D63_00220 [Candidatus Latescibacteria bacterium 4484_7]RKZ08116.1 MAG: hypothetical protein DRQ05_02080 [bacterium]
MIFCRYWRGSGFEDRKGEGADSRFAKGDGADSRIAIARVRIRGSQRIDFSILCGLSCKSPSLHATEI